MSAMGHREPGLPGALLTSPVPCGLIADGVHVHPAMVKLAFQSKGARGITLVTDAMEAMGMSPGCYRLSDREVIVDENSARLADGTLAGSILTMEQAMRNMIQFTGCSLAEALTMASTTPAQVLGLERKGRIAAGCDADLVILDESLCVTHTLVGGRLAYQRRDA
jgi:N-acetylglucosamine-6-phosphate deacetylase